MQKHQKTHQFTNVDVLQDGRYSCGSCQKVFNTLRYLKCHQKFKHANLTSDKISLPPPGTATQCVTNEVTTDTHSCRYYDSANPAVATINEAHSQILNDELISNASQVDDNMCNDEDTVMISQIDIDLVADDSNDNKDSITHDINGPVLCLESESLQLPSVMNLDSSYDGDV